MNPLLGSNISPLFLSLCNISSLSVSLSPFSFAAAIISSIGMVFPSSPSSSAIISLILIVLFLVELDVPAPDMRSMSICPVSLSIAICLRQ